jgi:hypothetical protein
VQRAGGERLIDAVDCVVVRQREQPYAGLGRVLHDLRSSQLTV